MAKILFIIIDESVKRVSFKNNNKNLTNNHMKKTQTFFGRTRLFIVTAFLLMMSTTAFAQNVSNPSFEILTNTGDYPNGFTQMNKAAGWSQPTGGTCDYFYGLPNPADFRVWLGAYSNPTSKISAQDGSAYVGGYQENVSFFESQYNYKEYITNKLSAKLKFGVTYDIVFYTQHVFGQGFGGSNYMDFIENEKGFLGVCFSSAAPTGANTTPTTNSHPNSGGIVDSWNSNKRVLIPKSNTEVYGAASRNNWVRVHLQYTADGTEEYMTIGQWRAGSSAMPQNNLSVTSSVYYLFDNFSPVIAPNAVLSKSLSTPSITDGGTAKYTFTITNTANGAISLSNLSFTDTLPSGLRIAASPGVNVMGLTGSGSVTATAGGTSVAVSGYSIVGGGQATITVNVTNAPGQLNPTCTGNPPAFTNSATNISNLSLNLTNNITPVCLAVTEIVCNAGTTQVPLTGSTLSN